MSGNYTLISHNKRSNRVSMLPIGPDRAYKTDIAMIDYWLLMLGNQERFESELYRRFGYHTFPNQNNYFIINPYMYRETFEMDIYDVFYNEEVSVKGKKLRLKKLLLELAKERKGHYAKREPKEMDIHSESFYNAWKFLFDYAHESSDFLTLIKQNDQIPDDLKHLFQDASQYDVEDLIEEDCLPCNYILIRTLYAYVLKTQENNFERGVPSVTSASFPIGVFPCSREIIRDYFPTSFVTIKEFNSQYNEIRTRSL